MAGVAGRRRSNCLAALKVLEMICDLLPACACSRKRGEGMGGRNVLRRGREREMAIANAGFPTLWGQTRVPPRKGGMERKME